MKIFDTSYKDVEAVVCETRTLRAVFLPLYGGKCTSMNVLENGRELLEQAVGAHYKKPVYMGDYIDAECSAFDDMFPTILPAHCEQFPWEGTLMPDHGEVYALPWQYAIESDRLHMWVYSLRFAYRLDKWISEREGGILIEYQARNLSEYDFDFLYSAHCMLAAEEGARLILPFKQNTPSTIIFSDLEELGGYGAPALWPCTKGIDFAETPPKETMIGYKFYFEEPIPEGWFKYVYLDGTALRVSFNPEQLPWFGLWVNYGAFKNMYNVAPEPSTAPFDRPDAAKRRGKASVLKGGATYDWHFHFSYK